MASKAKQASPMTVLLAALVVGLLLVVGGVIVIQSPWGQDLIETAPGVVPPGTEYSQFKFTAVIEDNTGTAVASMAIRVWYDGDGDGVMQYSELGMVTDASGTYTTNMEYPIGEDFTFWVQTYKSTTYQVQYWEVSMTGQRNSDGSAKTIGNLEVRATADDITFSGEANDAAFDTTDYNYTLSGTSGELEVDVIHTTADKGLSSMVWEGFDYEKAYGIYKDYPYFIKWDQIAKGDHDAIYVHKDSILAGTFLAMYCTIQDKVDLAVDVSDFDYNYNDGVNWYMISFFNKLTGDDFYNTIDSTVPRMHFTVEFGTITAAGTFVATYGVGLWECVKYDQMMAGSWTKGTALALGTAGDGWAWIA